MLVLYKPPHTHHLWLPWKSFWICFIICSPTQWYHHIFLEMFQSQNIYIYVPIRTKLRLFTQGTVVIQFYLCRQEAPLLERGGELEVELGSGEKLQYQAYHTCKEEKDELPSPMYLKTIVAGARDMGLPEDYNYTYETLFYVCRTTVTKSDFIHLYTCTIIARLGTIILS